MNAIKILKLKKNLILLKIPNYKNKISDYKSTLFGDLYQTRDLTPINKNFINLVTKKSIFKINTRFSFFIKSSKTP